MSAVIVATGLAASSGASGLDTQTVTSGGSGTALNQDRLRGFIVSNIGSIAPGTSSLYAGAAVTNLYWDEFNGDYQLAITGATNSGWTTLTINGTKALTRASATFASGVWKWATTDITGVQALGAIGTVHTCVFT